MASGSTAMGEGCRPACSRDRLWDCCAVNDKHILITGATNGIGLAAAEALAALGANLAIVGRSSDPFGLKSQSFISPLDHRFRRRDPVVGPGGGGFHIDDHCVLDVDQVIEAIAELHPLVGLCCPG